MDCKRKLNDVETELLISEVQIRPDLWNDCNKNFKNTAVTRKLWSEVGAQIKITGDEAKSKWKNLKDKYRKLVSKIPYVPSGSDGTSTNCSTNKWRFFNYMTFVKDVVSPGQTFGNLIPAAEEIIVELHGSDDGQILSEEDCNESSEAMSASLQRSYTNSYQGNKRRRYNKIEDKEDKFIKLEEKKIEAIMAIKKEDNGPDYHFMISLLPYIETLDPLEKLEVRSQMQTVVSNAYEKHLKKKSVSCSTA